MQAPQPLDVSQTKPRASVKAKSENLQRSTLRSPAGEFQERARDRKPKETHESLIPVASPHLFAVDLVTNRKGHVVESGDARDVLPPPPDVLAADLSGITGRTVPTLSKSSARSPAPQAFHEETSYLTPGASHNFVTNIARLQKRHSSLASVVAVQEDGLRMREEVCAALVAELETIAKVKNEQVSEIQSELEMYKSRAVQCVLLNRDESSAAEAARGEHQLLEGTVETLQRQISVLEEEVSQHSSRAAQSLNAQKGREAKLKSEHAEVKSTITDLIKEIDQLKLQLVDSQGKLAQKQAQAKVDAKARTRKPSDILASTRSLQEELAKENAKIERLQELAKENAAQIARRPKSKGMAKPASIGIAKKKALTSNAKGKNENQRTRSDSINGEASTSNVVADLKRRVSLLQTPEVMVKFSNDDDDEGSQSGDEGVVPSVSGRESTTAPSGRESMTAASSLALTNKKKGKFGKVPSRGYGTIYKPTNTMTHAGYLLANDKVKEALELAWRDWLQFLSMSQDQKDADDINQHLDAQNMQAVRDIETHGIMSLPH